MALGPLSPIGLVPTTDASLAVLTAVAIVCAVGLLLASRLPKTVDRGAWRVLGPLSAVLVVAIVSAVFSQQRFVGLFGAPAKSTGVLAWTALAGILVWAAMNAGAARSVLRRVAVWVLVGQIVLAVYQAVSGTQAVGTLSNSTFFGQVLLVLVPVATLQVRERIGVLSGPRAAIVPGVTASVLFAFGSFAAAALSVAFAVVVVVSALREPGAPWVPASLRSRLAVGIGGAVLIVAVPLAVGIAGPDSSLGSGLDSRPYLWEAASDAIGGAPVLGHGPDSYRVVAAARASDAITVEEGYQNRSFGSMAADPHNVALLVAAELGLAGLIALTWLVAEVLRNWGLQIGHGDHEAAWFAWAAALYVASLTLAPVALQTVALAVVVAGASLRAELPALDRRPQALRLRASHSLAIAGVVVVLAAVALGAHSITRLWAGSAPDALTRAQRMSAAADAWGADAFLRFSEARAWGALDSDEARTRVLEAAEHAVRLEPKNPFYWTDYAFFLGAYGAEEDETLAAYEVAEELYPASLDVPLYRAEHLLAIGDVDEAEPDVVRAVQLGASAERVQQLVAGFESAAGTGSTLEP